MTQAPFKNLFKLEKTSVTWKSPKSRSWRALGNALGPLFGLIGIYLFFYIIGPESFGSSRNLETIARQTTIVGIASLGMTVIMISGGIDLSVGSIISLSTVMIAFVLQNLHVPVVLAGFSGILVGMLAGIISGALIVTLRVVPFIITLGMMLFIRGVAKGLAHEQKIDAPLTGLNDLLAALAPGQKWMLAPLGVWCMIVLSLIIIGMLRFTRLGRYIFAIGSNEMTARLCGVAVERVKIIVYALGGAFFGLAGLMQFSRLTVGDPTVAAGVELDVIAAVVIGGGSLSGGEGSIFGSLVGALIMTVIRSGCSQMGLPNWVQEIVTAAIIVFAVALDRIRRRGSL